LVIVGFFLSGAALSTETADAASTVFVSGLQFVGGVATDSGGNVYVSESSTPYYGQNAVARVRKYSSSGQLLMTLGSPGSGPGQLNGPWGVAVDSDGKIYVAERGQHRISKFAADGTFITSFGSYSAVSSCDDLAFRAPMGITVSGTSLYVGSADSPCIQRLTTSGSFVSKFGGPGTSFGLFVGGVTGVATGSSGSVFAVGNGELPARVHVFDMTGETVSEWSAGSRIGGGGPSVAIGPPSGDVYVGDNSGTSCGHIVERRTVDGALIGSSCVEATGGDTAIAVNGSGDVFVTDGSRIIKLSGQTTAVITEPATTVLAGRATTLSASQSEAPFSTVSNYAWDLDGDGTYEQSTGTTPQAVSTFPSPGTKTVGLRVTSAENQVATTSRVIDVAADAVQGRLVVDTGAVSTGVVLTGREVRLDARGSTTQAGLDGGCSSLIDSPGVATTTCSSTVTRFEWDLDGDKTFETPGGATATIPPFGTAGTKSAAVRLTSRGGSTSVATVNFEVRLAPPTEDTGVSINGGAQFTNTPDVYVTLSWPAFATLARLSNDGGFGGAANRELAATVPWKLDSSGPERLPKTIYVRFRGAGDDTKTFQDDIILDQTAPEIAGASVANSAVARIAAKSRNYRIKVRASDKTSGVASAQFATDKSKKKLSKAQTYKSAMTFKATAKPLWVRVQDRAGNFSKWKKLP